MSEVKVTKREMFGRVASIVESHGTSLGVEVTDELAFLAHEVELLDRKRAAKPGKTPEQVENDGIKAAMATLLADAPEGMKSSDVATAMGIAVQKSTALLTQMVKAGDAVRKVDGKVVTFSV